ncbi:MAG: hypothetical protein WBL07_04660 [Thiothrix litoralis]|jgi:hypothetical protein|uniref:hypothetical protein n=1 Tax=Thiothrix litoralis TaxID=2891210 RepID=UPI003C747801
MFFIYLLSTLLILSIVLSALMPERARWVLEKLGLWDKVRAIDGNMMQRWMRGLGQFMLLLAVILTGSVVLGQHPAIWYVPAAQAAFFGVILWFFGKSPKHGE